MEDRVQTVDAAEAPPTNGVANENGEATKAKKAKTSTLPSKARSASQGPRPRKISIPNDLDAVDVDGPPRSPNDMDKAASKLFESTRIKSLMSERELVQKKTFTKWINAHLALTPADRQQFEVLDLFVDLRDGRTLLRLLELLSGERLPRPTRGKMRIHFLENIDKVLSFLREQKVHLENMGAHDIVDGNARLTLGLIWTIILRFQIQTIELVSDDVRSEVRSAKDALLLWCQMKTAGYQNVNVKNFTTSWRDGLAFNAIIHKHEPQLIEWEKLRKTDPDGNLENAFKVAERLGIPRLLDPSDVNRDDQDEQSIVTYVASYYHYFTSTRKKAGPASVPAKRVKNFLAEQMANEDRLYKYEFSAGDLLEWIRKKTEFLNKRDFPNTVAGVQDMQRELNEYLYVEKPPRTKQRMDLDVELFMLQSSMRARSAEDFHRKQRAKKASNLAAFLTSQIDGAAAPSPLGATEVH